MPGKLNKEVTMITSEKFVRRRSPIPGMAAFCPGDGCPEPGRYNDRAMKHQLTLSPAQAGALARLIRIQLQAYDEAASTGAKAGRKPPEPFTGADLDLIEPLIGLLEKAARSQGS